MRMALGGAVAAVLPLPVVRAKRINAVDALIDMGIPDSPRLQEMRAWLDELEVAEDYTGNHCIRCIFSFPNCWSADSLPNRIKPADRMFFSP